MTYLFSIFEDFQYLSIFTITQPWSATYCNLRKLNMKCDSYINLILYIVQQLLFN